MNRDELSVYADQLQIEGDIRGEIIALELMLEDGTRPDLRAQHAALMRQWLGSALEGWRQVRFRHGFVECGAADLERILATPAGRFLRSVVVAGSTTEILTTLRQIAASPQPHLERLSIAQYRRWSDLRVPRLRTSTVVDNALARAVIAATPALALLDVTGSRVFDAFPHPGVQRLRVVGHDAIGSLADTRAPMPGVRSLFFGFTHDPYGRIAFPEHGLPSTLLARATLPALVELDVSANELQTSWDNSHVALFEMLVELGVVPGLERLRVPPTVEDSDRDALVQLRAMTAATIEDTSDRPRPLHDSIDRNISLGVRIHDHPHEHQISHRRLGELMSSAWPALDAEARDAWCALWQALREVPRDPDDYWNYENNTGTAMSRAVLADALATLGDRIDDELAIAQLAEVAIASAAPHVYVRRYPY